MRKVIIIGSPGAGKSTFARELSAKTGLPLHYLDMIWHKPDRTTVTREEFDERLTEIMKEDEWIVDGNYLRTLPMRLDEADTVFFLDYPLEVCLAGAEERVGKRREDMPWHDDRLNDEFRQWILEFPEYQLPRIYYYLRSYRKDLHIFRSRDEADGYLKGLSPKVV